MLLDLWYWWSDVDYLALDHISRAMRTAPLSVIAACAALSMLRLSRRRR